MRKLRLHLPYTRVYLSGVEITDCVICPSYLDNIFAHQSKSG